MRPLLKKNVETPTLIIAPLANYKMHCLIKTCDKEVGWHGFIEDLGNNTYYLYDIILYPQFVTGATVEPTEEEYNDWINEQATNHLDQFNKMRMHGHSHVRMAVSPSAVDLKFREDLMANLNEDIENPFYFFLIGNKNDTFNIEMYDLKNEMIFDSSDIQILWEEAEVITKAQVWAEEVSNIYVKEKKYQCSTTSKASNSSTPKTAKGKFTSSDAEQSEEHWRKYWQDWD